MKKFLTLFALLIVTALFFYARPKERPGNISEAVSKEFANEQKVNIRGYAGNAMEPFISRNGPYLFWNSLNDGKDTSIFYAQKIDDVNFQLVGKVNNINGEPPHLDAVASMDKDGNFYWVSTRNYPRIFENYLNGKFHNGSVTEIAPVDGDFYIRKLGWIIMDAEISPDGSSLFFVNAKFTGQPGPVESDIGIALKIKDKFIKDPHSDYLLRNINTRDYLEYAPSTTADGLELFFTRLKQNETKIYVAKRKSTSEPFGKPELVDIKGSIPEAPSITPDGKNLYYHKKDGQYYQIYKMARNP